MSDTPRRGITDLFIRHPVLAVVVNLVIVLVGWRALSSLPIQQYPKIESSSVVITTVYYGAGAAGLAAIRPATGERAWVFQPEGRGVALGAAPTVIPGVVFQGGSNGRLYAVSAADGKQLWEFDTSQEFETVNRMVAHGGAISTSGAVIVDGMVYVGSGYAVGTGATAGNVLLAFGID